jgi:uncharacterized delta-60 repeat protein
VGGFTSTSAAESTGNRIFAIARYLPDGSLDTTFANAGKFFSTFGGNPFFQDNVSDILVLPNGKILFSNDGGSNTELVRLNSDGSIDTTFGSSGRIFGTLGSPTFIGTEDMLLDSQGRILMAGNMAGKLGVKRLLSDGSLDTTFAETGYFSSNFGTSYCYARSIALQPDGRILVGGLAGAANAQDAILLRLVVPEPSAGLLLASSLAVLFSRRPAPNSSRARRSFHRPSERAGPNPTKS